MTAESDSRTEKIAVCLNMDGAGNNLTEQTAHRLFKLWADTTPIKVY